MALDVYHKVLHKLFEATDGKSSKTVDFKQLVKQMGFFGNYTDIFTRLSGEGWIVESPKQDYVSISHWGAAEVKKTLLTPENNSGASDSNLQAQIEANKALSSSQELSLLLESFAQMVKKDNFPPIEKKLDQLQNAIAQIKKNLT